MASLYDLYDTYWYKYADQRMLEFPLFGSPIPMILIIAGYWIMIKKGPGLMADKPAFDIKPIIQVYNVLQVVLCAYFGFGATFALLRGSLQSLRCIDHSSSTKENDYYVFCSIAYLWMKVADCLDTLFFILRKRFSLLTTLHTYHHTLMAFCTWIILRYHPGGEMTILGALNCIVHTVMYSYYFYCICNGGRQNVWWKKHITQLQLAQFAFLLIVYTYKFFYVHDCKYPKGIVFFCMMQTVVMMQMFVTYYRHAFMKDQTPAKEVNNNVDAGRMKEKAK